MWPRILIVLALLLPVPAAAQVLQGTWAFKVEGTAIFRFHLSEEEDGWSGTWERPRSFASNGVVFVGVSGPVVATLSASSREIGEWIELTFEDPRPGAVPDIFMFRVLGNGTLEALYSGTGFEPLMLERVLAGEPVGGWPEGMTYRRASAATAPPGALVQFTAVEAPPRDALIPPAQSAAPPLPPIDEREDPRSVSRLAELREYLAEEPPVPAVQSPPVDLLAEMIAELERDPVPEPVPDQAVEPLPEPVMIGR